MNYPVRYPDYTMSGRSTRMMLSPSLHDEFTCVNHTRWRSVQHCAQCLQLVVYKTLMLYERPPPSVSRAARCSFRRRRTLTSIGSCLLHTQYTYWSSRRITHPPPSPSSANLNPMVLEQKRTDLVAVP